MPSRWWRRDRDTIGGTIGDQVEDQPAEPEVRVVPIREDTIRLGQFLKLADLVDNGAEAKPLVQGGEVLVNGEVEMRRGRQLIHGDEVTLDGVTVRVGEPTAAEW